MSQIDPQQIQQLLQEGKIASMSDILAFIAQQVNVIANTRIEQLQQRVMQLERPKGMDRVMIEEVKTLVEAMIDQREENMRRGLDRKMRDNISSFQMQENSRQSLNQVDFTNFINLHHGPQSQQLRKPNAHIAPQLPAKFDNLQLQIAQIRDELLSKSDRRQLQQLKTTACNLGKEVVAKVTFEQVQKLMIKFQKDTFLKIAEGRGQIEELQARILKYIDTQYQIYQRQIQDLSKNKGAFAKLEKRVKKQAESIQQLFDKISLMDRFAIEMQNQVKQNQGLVIQDMGQLQGLVERIAEQKEDYLLPKHIKTEDYSHIGKRALWMAAPPAFKNSCVVWSRQIANQEPQNLEFDSGKSCIRLVAPGFYEITCMIYGGTGKKPPVFICNSQSVIRFQQKNSQAQCISRWQLREWIQIRQSRSQLFIRVQTEDSFSCILLQICRLSC